MVLVVYLKILIYRANYDEPYFLCTPSASAGGHHLHMQLGRNSLVFRAITTIIKHFSLAEHFQYYTLLSATHMFGRTSFLVCFIPYHVILTLMLPGPNISVFKQISDQ